MLGAREEALHVLSLVFAVLTMPVAFVLRARCSATRRLDGGRPRSDNPFLTQYAQETRMYALVVLLAR